MTKDNISLGASQTTITLKDFVLENGPIHESYIRKSLMDMLSELYEMHEEGICHNDICPDNIVVEEKSCGGLVFQLKSSSYAAEPSMGNGVLNRNDCHCHFWAPENYIGETSFLSDQYQLAMTMYFVINGSLPPQKKCMTADNIVSAFEQRDFLPDDFADCSFEKCLLKALRLNPTERFRSMDEWLVCLLEDIVNVNAYSDFLIFNNTMKPGGFLYIKGDHRQTYCNFFGAKSCKPNANVMKAYEKMGVRIIDNDDFRCYSLQTETDGHTYVYFPNGRCRQLFRLMTASLSAREALEGKGMYSSYDISYAINKINKASKNVRGFMCGNTVFLSYEKIMYEKTDYENLINEAHKVLQDTDVLMWKLLEGGKIETSKKTESWNSIPVFCINENNVLHLQIIIHAVNVALAKTRCVVRNNRVCIEGPKDCIHDGVEIFEFIKNYSYQI